MSVSFHTMRGGYGLIEIVVAIALVVTFVSSIAAAAHFELRAVNESARRSQVAFLLEEGVEAVRSIRDRGWTAGIQPLVSGTVYYPVFSIQWKLVTTDPGPLDGRFTRTVVVGDIYRRDSDADIVDVSSGDPKTIDPSTKLVTVTVQWTGTGGGTQTQAIATYITDLFGN